MAFPATVWKPFSLPTGVWLGVVPPSSEVVDIELSWRTTGSTSFDYLETLSGQTAQGRYSYTHYLPLSTQRYYYRARSIANGKTPSTYLEVSATPAQLPMLPHGAQTANEPVLGREFRVRVTGLDCRPFTHTALALYTNSFLTLSSGPANLRFGCSVSIPTGSKMVRAISRGRMSSPGVGSSIVTRVGITDTNGGYFAFGGSMVQSSTSFTNSSDPSPVTDTISTDQSVAVRVDLISTGAIPEFAWVDIYYTVDSYAQLRT